MAEKRVKLFMVEGPSDETAFGLLFERLFADDRVLFDVAHGDVTAKPGAKSARNAVRDQLIGHIEHEYYGWKDLMEIVHIVDSDGVFIGDDKVVAAEGDCLEYGLGCIKAPRVESILRRNHAKAAALSQLRCVTGITYQRVTVPYRVYYVSRNLEHALHGVVEDVSDREKERLARAFQRRYRDDLEGFAAFMRDEIGIAGDYAETWEHLRQGENSLARGSNLHLALP